MRAAPVEPAPGVVLEASAPVTRQIMPDATPIATRAAAGKPELKSASGQRVIGQARIRIVPIRNRLSGSAAAGPGCWKARIPRVSAKSWVNS